MTYWLTPADPLFYDFDKSFKDHQSIDWRQKNNFNVGDIVFIYNSGIQAIQNKCVVTEVNKLYPNIRNDSGYYSNPQEFWESIKGKFSNFILNDKVDKLNLSLKNLRIHGLKSNLQKPVILKGGLLELYNLKFQI